MHVELLAERLASRGHDVEILASARFYQRAGRTPGGIEITGLPLTPRGLARSAWTALFQPTLRGSGARARLHRLHAGWRARAESREWDVFHVHALYNQFVPALREVRPEVPIVLTVHSYHHLLSRPNASRREHAVVQEVLDTADAVIHVSQADRRVCAELGFSVRGADFVIPHGVEPMQPHPLPWPRRPPEILFSGNLIPRKRPDLVLEAWRQLADRVSAELIIAGKGRMSGRLKNRGIPRVRFLDHLPHATMREVIARAKLLVVPSTSESFGLVYAEALVSGTPVIGYEPVLREFQDLMGASSQARRFMVPHSAVDNDPEALASQILRLWEDVHTSQDLSRVIADEARSVFGWDRVLEQTLYAYNSAIQARD